MDRQDNRPVPRSGDTVQENFCVNERQRRLYISIVIICVKYLLCILGKICLEDKHIKRERTQNNRPLSNYLKTDTPD